MAGWALGITENAPLVTGAIAGVANASVAAARGGISASSPSITEGLANLPNTAQQPLVINSAPVFAPVIQGHADASTVAQMEEAANRAYAEHTNTLRQLLAAR
jgi:hypothetical protein